MVSDNNFFENVIKFKLIDVDNVLTDEIEINEPVNFGETTITGLRSDQFHGFDFEFSDPETQFGFDRIVHVNSSYSAYRLIEEIELASGVDGRCILQALMKREPIYKAVERQVGDGYNISSLLGFLRVLADLSYLKAGDVIYITAPSSIYDGQSYTVVSATYNFPTLPDYTIIEVVETIVDGAYDGDWSVVDSPSFELIYEGELDFTPASYKKSDFLVEMNARRINVDDLFRTRFETPVNITASNTIDGTAITALASEDMFLHSKVIRQSQQAKSSAEVNDGSFIPFPDETAYVLFLDYYKDPVINSIETNYGRGVITQIVDYTTFNILDYTPHYIFTRSGFLRVDYSADYDLVVTNMNTYTLSYLGTFINIGGVETQINADFDVVADSAFFSANVAFDYEGEFYIEKGQSVYIYDKWSLPINIAVNPTHNIVPSLVDHLMTLEFDGVDENSISKVYSGANVIQRILKIITDSQTEAVGNWLEILEQFYITNGYSIRSFGSRPPYVSFKNIFEEWASPTFGLGFGFVKSGSAYKVLIDKVWKFYQDKEIYFVDEIQNESWLVSMDKSLFFNEIEVGYSEFPSSTDENKSNNLDEFNTVHNNITPLKRIKNKGSFISDIIASGYKIENQRAEQFADVPKDTVSDDDKLFVIKGTKTAPYKVLALSDGSRVVLVIETNTVSIYGVWFDIKVADLITIVRISDGFILADGYAATAVSTSLGYTIITFAESFSPASSTVNDWNVYVTGDRIRASRSEEFSQADNLISPETQYNIGLNPKFMLINNAPLINSGLYNKSETEKIKTQEAKLNDEMICTLLDNSDYTLARAGQSIQMNGEILLSDFDGNNKIFTGRLLEFMANIPFGDLTTILNAFKDYGSEFLYGKIKVKDPFGEIREGYPMMIQYKLLSNEVKFVLREKNPNPASLNEYEFYFVIGFATQSDACLNSDLPTVYYSDLTSLIIGATIYSETQNSTSLIADGWIYQPSTNNTFEIVDGAIATIGGTCIVPIPDPETDKFASYNFQNLLGFINENTTDVIIDGLNYFESDTVDINIGFDGTTITASLVVTSTDIVSAMGGEIIITLNVYNGSSSSFPEIGTQVSDSTGVAGEISVSKSITNEAITSEIFIVVKLLLFAS